MFFQMGRESVAGTEVNATAIWRGTGAADDASEYIWPDEDVGYLSRTDRQCVPKYLGKVTLDTDAISFEQILYPFDAGVKTVTAVADGGGGSGKIYTYIFPTTAANTIKTYTLEFGDEQQEEQMLYSFCESFSLRGQAGEPMACSSSWAGRQITPGTKTAGVALATVDEILISKGKLYIDAASGTIGSTQKSNTLLTLDFSAITGWVPVFTADGNLYFSFAKMSYGQEVVLKLTFEHDATSVAEKAAWRAGTPRQIRLLFQGAALTTPGSGYTYKTLILDMAGKWEKFDKLDEMNGNDVVTGTFRARYNVTADLFCEAIVVNELAAVV